MAQATTIELFASAAQTADSETPTKLIPTLTMVAIGVDITAVSGTTPVLSTFLQCSDDGGTTWYDVPYDLRLKTNASGADQTADTNGRNIADEETAVGKIIAIYKHIPFEAIRLANIITGTTPSFTMSASLVGK